MRLPMGGIETGAARSCRRSSTERRKRPKQESVLLHNLSNQQFLSSRLQSQRRHARPALQQRPQQGVLQVLERRERWVRIDSINAVDPPDGKESSLAEHVLSP